MAIAAAARTLGRAHIKSAVAKTGKFYLTVDALESMLEGQFGLPTMIVPYA